MMPTSKGSLRGEKERKSRSPKEPTRRPTRKYRQPRKHLHESGVRARAQDSLGSHYSTHLPRACCTLLLLIWYLPNLRSLLVINAESPWGKQLQTQKLTQIPFLVNRQKPMTNVPHSLQPAKLAHKLRSTIQSPAPFILLQPCLLSKLPKLFVCLFVCLTTQSTFYLP